MENKENLQKNKKIHEYLINYFKIIIFLSVLVVLILGFFLLVRPKYKEIQTKSRYIAYKNKEYADLDNTLKEINKIHESYKTINQEEIAKLNMVLPGAESRDELISQLNALVTRNGLLLTSLQVDEAKEDRVRKREDLQNDTIAGTGNIKITMNILGTNYEALKIFLNSLENNLRIIDVKKLSFSPSGKSLTIEALTYYME